LVGLAAVVAAASGCGAAAAGCPGNVEATLSPRADDGIFVGVEGTRMFANSTSGTRVVPSWWLAAADATKVLPSVGVVGFTEPSDSAGQAVLLNLELPFPLSVGQTLPLAEGGPADFDLGLPQIRLRPSTPPSALLRLDLCMPPPNTSVTNCSPEASQSVAGTLDVVSTSPLAVHLVATFSGAGPVGSLDDDLTFVDMPDNCTGPLRID
jgi:hypothetical protein